MVAVKNIVLLAVSASAAVIPRTAATIESDLMTINSDVESLTSAVKSYTGGLIGAIPVENANSALEKAINSATTDAKGTSELSAADSETAINFINDTLEPNIEAAISALEAKKSQIAAAGLTSTVQGDLNTLKSDTDSYGSALLAITPSSETSAGNAAIAKINTDFAGAISDFS